MTWSECQQCHPAPLSVRSLLICVLPFYFTIQTSLFLFSYCSSVLPLHLFPQLLRFACYHGTVHSSFFSWTVHCSSGPLEEWHHLCEEGRNQHAEFSHKEYDAFVGAFSVFVLGFTWDRSFVCLSQLVFSSVLNLLYAVFYYFFVSCYPSYHSCLAPHLCFFTWLQMSPLWL